MNKQPANMMVYFDNLPCGHHYEHAFHVARRVLEKGAEDRTVFAVHEGFRGFLRTTALSDAANRLQITPQHPPKDEVDQIRGADACLQAIRKVCEENHATHCFIDALNPFQLALSGSCLAKSGVRLAGILYHPYPRLVEGWRWLYRPRTLATVVRKYMQTYWLLRTRSLQTVFILSDKEAPERLCRWHLAGGRFESMADPVWMEQELSDGTWDPRQEFDVPPDRKIFLLFGSLAERKGIYKTLSALRLMLPEDLSKVSVVFAGVVGKTDRDRFAADLAITRRTCPTCRILFLDGFLPASRMNRLFKAADVILAPYLRTEGGSGIIGHAAREAKPILGSRTGLTGHQIRDYRLGLDVDATHPSEIAAAMSQFVRQPSLSSGDLRLGALRYCGDNRASDFASTVVDRFASL